jgi:predicted aldo/keto reductase-like oxidoreductase
MQEAIDRGINLFETSTGYINSEKFIGQAVKGCREKVIISTKCCIEDYSGKVFSPQDLESRIYQSLERLQTDYIDIYNIWRIKSEFFGHATKTNGFIDIIRKFMDQGVIHHFGFSSHDSVLKLKEYMDTNFFESIIVNKNILDDSNDPAIIYAYKKGMGVLIMRPLYGGFLCSDLDCLSFLNGNKDTINKAFMNLVYLLNNKYITSLLVGMTNKKEVIENCDSVIEYELNKNEVKSIISTGLENSILKEIKLCSGCGYCDFCPVKIPVSLLMKVYNFANLKEINVTDRSIIKKTIQEYGVNFDLYKDCVECGRCEKLCTSRLDIINRIKVLKSISKSL